MYPKDFIPFFEGTMTIEQYVELDEAVVLYYLKKWIHENDTILSDLSDGLSIEIYLNIFLRRFNYYHFELQELFEAGGINPGLLLCK